MTPEEKWNIRNARWTLIYEGELVPVTNMFDYIGQYTLNPLRAFSCALYCPSTGEWMAMQVHPGEITVKKGDPCFII